MAETDEQTPLWTPSAERVDAARMTHFMAWAGARHDRSFADYEQLWGWSVTELERFWGDMWEYGGVLASVPYERVLAAPGPSGSQAPHTMPGARWFDGARLNYAENLLCRRLDAPGLDGGDPLERSTRTAVVHCSELRPQSELSWGELGEQVAAVAAGMRSLGVEQGDRVAAYMPNVPETLIAFLACASIGAIWSCAAPEFGASSVVDRFAQIEPKLLLCCDGYRHGGKDFDRRAALREILAGLPSVEHVALLAYLDESASPEQILVARTPDGSSASRSGASAIGGLSWPELCALGAGAEPRFEQVPFDHPLWVLYSSGTTGLPKPLVHGHGGILLEQLKKSILHLDLHRGQRMFWFTTTGWMMWNFLVGCLFAEAAIVLYDGSPAHPDLGRLWQLVQDARIGCMGVSAGLLTAGEKAGIEPAREYDLSSLRAIGSTGSPLPPEGFHWVYEHVGSDLWLFSTSGGTDVCTAFVGGCPLLPVYAGELQCRALGAAVESWDEQGRALSNQVGELVLTQPLPSMPLYLWGDEHESGEGDPTLPGRRYRESYFDVYPGIWRHGDWVRITPRGGAVIYGRSDSTINRQGVRMGTSEIYRATWAVPQVTDALVVDVPQAGGDLEMVLFVVLREGVRLDDELRGEIKRRVREYCSPRHVPNEILQIEEVPRTLSGKALEVPIKRILMGAAPSEAASVESLANPHALDYFVRLARERREEEGEPTVAG
ncbi:MAG TPA: acetoacetate--CoA ligase [Solirubrobacteraceae bacterium]|jgi:acetoacetyl-CoA synthetase|nr:acetoacetate--CoA ligase [Solirubrobacteraceae bacterium]